MKDIETIYSNIPVPDVKEGPNSLRWKKFISMKVGDCVFLETRKDANLLMSYLKNRGISTVSRTVNEQFGVWSVEKDG